MILLKNNIYVTSCTSSPKQKSSFFALSAENWQNLHDPIVT